MSDKDRGGEPPDRKGRPGTRKEDWIARHLRRVYDEALGEEIPADMLALLGKLDNPSDEQDER